MLCLGKQARALCTPGEKALAFRQVVEMLSYWEMGVEVSFIISLTGRRMERRGGITVAEA